MLTKIKLIRILGIYTMAVLFLPVVIQNIPTPLRIITGTVLLLGIFWVIVIVSLRINILFSKLILTIIGFALLLYFGSQTFWSDRIYSSAINLKWIVIDLFGVFLSSLMYLYFLFSRDYKGLALISVVALIFIVITSITSTIGLSLYPFAVRELTSGGAGGNDALYGKIGIAGYTFWIGVIYLFPVLIYLFKKINTDRRLGLLMFTIILILLLAMLKTQISTAIVLSMLFTLYAILTRGSLKFSGIFFLIFAFFSIFIINTYIADFFYYLSSQLNSELLQSRITDVGRVFELQDFDPNSGETYFSTSRLSRIFISIDSFLGNPIAGNKITGGHSTWFDKLGMFGIVGFLPWIIIFRQQIILNLQILDKAFLPYYLLSVFGCIVAGILTTTANSVHSSMILFFIVPGLSFINYLGNNKS